ncbi:MAG: hypothetical protein V2B20_19145 [Pseudomonadota bacterium]
MARIEKFENIEYSREREISVAGAKAVLAKSTAQSFSKLHYLVNQALIREIEPKSLYGLAEHLPSRFSSDQESDQFGRRLVTPARDQPQVTSQEPSKVLQKLEHFSEALFWNRCLIADWFSKPIRNSRRIQSRPTC